MESVVDIVLLSFLCITVVAIVYIRKLFCAIMLLGIFSLLSASLFVTMDAVDVAFTEAAVGTGISSILLLSALALTHTREQRPPHQPYIALLVVVVTGAVLIYGTMDLPRFGDPNSPIHRHVAVRYIADSPHEVGPPNIVTSVLASYRGYDTLGETVVIFTAGIALVGLLGFRRRQEFKVRLYQPMDKKTSYAENSTEDGDEFEDNIKLPGANHMVLRIVGKMFIPLILLFALYVQFHGDYGPGGGFQAGVIFASGIILYALIFDVETAMRVITPKGLRLLAVAGVFIYGGVGLVCMFLGGNFLDYNVLSAHPLHGQHLGIFLIELGVGINVFAIMVIMFYTFANRKRGSV
ncbi:MAG: cation:proton antiporter [Desulfobacteraceae bacterium 4572_35.1]|nr:MAG: cation:proton antiporter [Desulfobacteraceae bacterium 4572_35.1]